MPTLPPRPNIEQLKKQAKDLLKAARNGDRESIDRLREISDDLTLTVAQESTAHQYGFQRWADLAEEVRRLRGEG